MTVNKKLEKVIPDLVKMKGRDIQLGDLIALENDLWVVDLLMTNLIPHRVYVRVKNLDGYKWWPYIPLDEDVMVIRLPDKA